MTNIQHPPHQPPDPGPFLRPSPGGDSPYEQTTVRMLAGQMAWLGKRDDTPATRRLPANYIAISHANA